jgi:hypothetical protein
VIKNFIQRPQIGIKPPALRFRSSALTIKLSYRRQLSRSNHRFMKCTAVPAMISYKWLNEVSGIANPTIRSRYANIAMFITYQHNQFLKKWIMINIWIRIEYSAMQNLSPLGFSWKQVLLLRKLLHLLFGVLRIFGTVMEWNRRESHDCSSQVWESHLNLATS